MRTSLTHVRTWFRHGILILVIDIGHMYEYRWVRHDILNKCCELCIIDMEIWKLHGTRIILYKEDVISVGNFYYNYMNGIGHYMI